MEFIDLIMSLVLDLLFPKYCYGCRKSGNYLCSKCLSELKTKSLKTNFKSDIEGFVGIFKYDGIVRHLLHDLKYKFITDLSDDLAKIIASRIKKDFKNLYLYWRKNKFVVISIPLHQFRQNWRGFNQSSVLGKKIAQKLKLKFEDNLLIRKTNTISQTKIKMKTLRKSNVAGVFAINKDFVFEKVPKNIIIFDDILTTGSTIKSASQVLKNPNIKSIWGLTVA